MGLSGVITVPKKSEKPKVKIIPPRLWPSLFLTIGVYDILHDLIFIKGGLPKITFRQTLKHENAHRKWFLSHPRIRKFYVFLYWKPVFYYILFMSFIILYLCSVSLWLWDIALSSSLICISLMVFHYSFDYALERPAMKEAGHFITGVSVKEQARLTVIKCLPLFLFLLMSLVFPFLSPEAILALVGLGFLITWVYQFLHILVLNNLRKK